MSDIPEDSGDRRYGVRGVRETQEREIRTAAYAERRRIAAERMKELLEEEKQIKSQREDVMKVVKKENKKRFYQDLDRAGATGSSTITKIKLIDLFNNSAKEQLEGNIKLDKEKVKNEVRNRKNLLEKKIWTKDVAVAYGKLLTAIDPMTSRIHSIPRKRERRKTKKRKTRKTRKRRRIGKNKKQLKRLQTQYRRFRIAKSDKRFKGNKGLVKWSRPSKAKRKGKKRSRRIYHRKRK